MELDRALQLDDVQTAIEEVRALVADDGLDVELVGLDLPARSLTMRVVVDDADCDECVMPPEVLSSVVGAELRKRLGGDATVTVRDPRVGSDVGSAATGPGAESVIVDPTGVSLTVADPGPGPDVGSLVGKVVGVRVDVLWRSWDWVVDEWARGLRDLGAEVVLWRRAQGLDGDAGADHHDGFARFLDEVDAAIVGLANCGSCTSWTIKDSVAAAARGLPTVAIATAHFEALAGSLAELYGRPSLRVGVLPYPLDVLPEAEVREIARAHFDVLLDRLGADVDVRTFA